jgi:hypothetical protein
MGIANFLDQVAHKHGSRALHGAIVFVMTDRPLSRWMSRMLARRRVDKSAPSPWSHCFLLAEPYRGASTRILDCSVRDAMGRIEWEISAGRALKMLLAGSIGSGIGGVYDAELGDYDNPRIMSYGIRWLPQATAFDRVQIVERALALQRDAIRFDLLGLFRTLFWLLTGIRLKPSPKRLFCSAFAQHAYRAALGNAGAFQPTVRDEDTTPDDIWFSPKGHALAHIPKPAEACAQTLDSQAHRPTAECTLQAA